MNEIRVIRSKLKELANDKNAEVAQRFFKTGPGEYGEGDKFLGIRVPVLRELAKEHQTITVEQAEHLLKSQIHEERLLALFILINDGSETAYIDTFWQTILPPVPGSYKIHL